MNRVLLLISLLILFTVTAKVTAQTVASYDTVTIYDIQYVPPESLAVKQDDSPFEKDTVIVEGIIATGPRSLWIGARWSGMLVGEQGGPWNGIQVVQNDTNQTGTLFSALKPGYKVRITCEVREYPFDSDRTFPTHTEVILLDNPPVPVELLGYGYTIPAPTTVTCADLALDTGEKYEDTFVRIENATVINNAAPGFQMLIADVTGQLVVDEWGKGLYDSLRMGTYNWPPNGANINIQGYLRADPNGLGFQIGPITSADVTILTNPPSISDVKRNPIAPTSNDEVTVTARIKDSDGTVANAQLHFKLGSRPWQVGEMTASDSIYSRTLPKMANGIMVQYFIKAFDNFGEWSILPGDTATSKFFYTVRDGGLSIKDLQWTPFRDGNSPYLGYEVTVAGIVTASPDDILGDYVIQSSQESWSGILVDDAANLPQRGDSVRVTGTVRENYNYTQLSAVTAFEILGSGYNIEPLKLTTGQAKDGSSEAESYEGMLLEFNNVIVSDPFPDRTANYGEITIDDGTGGYRVGDDFSIAYRGNLDSVFAKNDRIEKIIGIGNYSFYHYKLDPRNDEDVIGHTTNVKKSNRGPELSFDLKQNYPNPFNPTTTINYTLAKNGLVELTVYNLMGQKIKTLVHEVKNAGQHVVQWDGRNNAGQSVASGLYFYNLKTANFMKTNKMILLR